MGFGDPTPEIICGRPPIIGQVNAKLNPNSFKDWVGMFGQGKLSV